MPERERLNSTGRPDYRIKAAIDAMKKSKTWNRNDVPESPDSADIAAYLLER